MFEIGSSLRDARVRKGLDLQELEAETKIRAKYLRALEEERFDLLPGDTYVKGFLRIYAERLGLDGQLYVDEFNSRFSLSEEPVPATRPRRRARQGRFEVHAVLVALAGIVAVTVLVIAAWQLGGPDGGNDSAPPESPAATSPESSGTAAGATADTTAAAAVRLVVTAKRGASRVEVRRGSSRGELLFEGTLAKARSQQFDGVKLWVSLARSANVDLRVNGELADVPGGSGPAAVIVSAAGVRRASA